VNNERPRNDVRLSGWAVGLMLGALCAACAAPPNMAGYAYDPVGASPGPAGTSPSTAGRVADMPWARDASSPVVRVDLGTDASTPAVRATDAATLTDSSVPDAGAKAAPTMDGGEHLACTAVEVAATVRAVPVDIVWAIDSSGSMRNERDAIQQNLNAFARKFADAAIDVHVVVITDASDFEVPAPLGSDSKRFLFLDRRVGSHDALSTFIERYANYSAFLRPDARLELIAVTDDESHLKAGEFISDMRASAGKDFRLHAIASERVDGRACRGAHSPGDEYYAAAAQTSGLTFSICQADSAPLFEALSDRLTENASPPCTLELPAAPVGQKLDPNLINVVQDAAGTATRQVIPRVDDVNSCTDLGWFYDEPQHPSSLTFCPRSCMGLGTAALHIAFGCQTMVLL